MDSWKGSCIPLEDGLWAEAVTAPCRRTCSDRVSRPYAHACHVARLVHGQIGHALASGSIGRSRRRRQSAYCASGDRAPTLAGRFSSSKERP